jgi:hypothetical protein
MGYILQVRTGMNVEKTYSALTFTGVVRDNHDRPVTLTYFPSQDLNLGVS